MTRFALCRRIGRMLMLGGIALSAAAAPTAASDRVARALLEALRANGTIDARQYEDLSRLVEDEAAAEAAASAAPAPPPADEPPPLSVTWNDGIQMQSQGGAFEVRIGGRLNNDWGVVAPDEDLRETLDDDAGQGTGTKFRRARLAMSGTIWERTGFELEFEFSGGDVQLTDALIEFLHIPYAGTVTVGHFKEPFSIDEQTSANHHVFVERALTRAFSPVRNTGFMLQNHALEERVQWGFGVFRDVDDYGDGFGDDATYNVTGRVTGLPWYENGGERLLHVGLSASHRFRDGVPVRFRSRPEVRLGNPNYVDTGDIPSDGVDVVNPELALVYGPFSFQAEYTHAFVHGDGDAGDPSFYGVHAQAAYMLTGETRPYRASEGVFDRVIPERNFDLHGGLGAFEVALRYSHLDLDDGGVNGGILDDGTVGLNWFLNPNVRTSFNYVVGRLRNVGWTNQFVARFQVEF